MEKFLEKVLRKFDGSYVRDGNIGNIVVFLEVSNREKLELLKEICWMENGLGNLN